MQQGGKSNFPQRAQGRRVYLHSSIDHNSLFDLLEDAAGEVMLTYDDAKEVRDLATAHGFFVKPIAMKTTHHTRCTNSQSRITPLQWRVLTSLCVSSKNRRATELNGSQDTVATSKSKSLLSETARVRSEFSTALEVRQMITSVVAQLGFRRGRACF
jgi:hypothetical protein